MLHRLISCCFLLCLYNLNACAAADSGADYSILYDVSIQSGQQRAEVMIELRGDTLPSKLVLHLDPKQHHIDPNQPGLKLNKQQASWRPGTSPARLRYQFAINQQRQSGSYDSRITEHWAILRADKLIPPITTTAVKGLQSSAELKFRLPAEWSSALPYPAIDGSNNNYNVVDPGRRFIRPKGWLLLGELASRRDKQVVSDDEIEINVAAPSGQNARLQDTLAFIRWNLPTLKQLLPVFPSQVLVVMAGDPMWRGGLSGTRSLFMHSDRPLISGNRTSSLLHELVHVAAGISADKESDWIVEGLAEFYALEILRRSNGISQQRFEQALAKLHHWGLQAPSLLVKRSSGAITARAASLLYQVDQEIRSASSGRASLDDVIQQLANKPAKVTLHAFTTLVEQAAGSQIKLLDREALARQAVAWE